MIVVPAPRGHAMKIADILGLRQREELRPRQRQRILDEPAEFELPRLDGDVRVLAEIEHGPVLHFVLSDRKPRHAVAVRLTSPRRLETGEFDVDRALVERDLPRDIFLTAFDEVTHEHVVSRATRRGWWDRTSPQMEREHSRRAMARLRASPFERSDP